MKKLSILLFLAIVINFPSFSQITTGFFGGNASASGYTNTENTQNKWIKIAEMTLNGPYNPAGFTIDFYPRNSNHGDAHERLNVQFRNTSGSSPDANFYRSTYDISLIHLSGQHHTVKDAKVVYTSGSGTSNNKLSVWVQMGISWLFDVPIEIRKYGNVTVQTTHQPYYESIQETGETFSVQTRYTFRDGQFEFDGTVKAEKIIADPDAWPDYVFEADYDLKSLEEVEAYIKTNGHLPNIAPADTFLTNGVSLGEMNVKLLEKIEELTLYTIEQEKQIKDQVEKEKQQNQQLKRQSDLIEELLQRVSQLENQ